MMKCVFHKIKKHPITASLAVAVVLLLAAVITLTAFLTQKKTREEAQLYYDMKCESYATQNANLAKGQIVFIGDSITDLYVLDEHYADLPLAAYNRGIGGDMTQGVLGRLKVSVTDIEPAYVVLMIGTNDINWGVDQETILTNYGKILDTIYVALPDVELYCMSIIPQNTQLMEYSDIDVHVTTQKILSVNPKIKELAEGKGATYLDLFSRLADENNLLIRSYSDDGLHLNKAGLDVWTELLKPYLLASITK
ncbi:MAG: hypothetical protein J6A88_01915 [Oscillospiraceae bacterium]|nr:hypothetical protein [Oscillospiraceae bacterium]